MSRYKSYPQYEKSKLQWADRTPKHWNSVHLRWIAKLYAGGTPSKAIEEYWKNGSVPWINSGEVSQGLISEVSTYITEAAYKNSSAKWIPKNALVMALAGQGKTKGMIAQLAIDATCNQSMAAIVPQDLQNSRYLFWWLHSNYQNIRNMAGGDLRDGLNLELLGDIGCPIPNVEEQLSIAAFLDHETAKIDVLIEKQLRLIELLKEKRQAVISHAVTKGLNPNAPMKDSDVDWLGEVPAHWTVCRLKHAIKSGSSISYGIVQPGEPLDDGVPFVQTTNMSRGSFGIDDLQKTTKEIAAAYPRSTLEGGEVILGIRASIGAAHVVPESLKGVNLSRGVARITPGMSLLSSYLVLFFGTDAVSRYWELSKQGSTFSEVSIETVREMSLLIPPKSEQLEIEKSIKQRLSKMDVVLNLAVNKVSLLQERRTAVISAAVTGKIDVRDWQAAA
ncbi:restriction endonuclease subunit S [Comamonas sp. SY3]|uniref:restriction endonuclease subunit S n=1 Tax=Comamonas sp. SY3 TaxID=3243601 RepID=UPI0035945C1D